MTAGHSASCARRWGRLTIAFTLAISLVTIPAEPARAAIDDYRDDFASGFSGSIGSADWATDWIENGESDGPGAGGIKVEVEPHCVSGACLTLGRLGTGGGNVSVEREADLSRASTASLQFAFKRHDHPGVSGQVVLEVSANGGGTWAPPLQTWDLSVTDPAPATTSFDISDYRSDDTRIRFRLINDTDQSHFNVDNLAITANNDLSPHNGGIVINEVLFDQSPAADEEFVEVFNATAGTVSLAGWQFANRADTTFYTFPPGTSLASGEYAVIWTGTVDPGGLRDASYAAFQDGANEVSNFLWDNGDAIWLHDDGGLRVDFVAWGTGSPSPPPEWDATHEESLDTAATARGQSISLTPNGLDGNDSACWEPTTSGDASGRCAGYLPTADIDPVAQLWTPGVSNQGPPINNPPTFDQDLGDRSDAEGTLITISSPATDPDGGDTLTYSALGLPEGISIDTGTGLLTGAPGPNAAGTHAVTITVTDNGIPNLTDVDTFTWTVTAGEVAYLVANTGGGNGGDDLLTAVDLTDPDPATNEINIGTGTGTTNIEAIALQPGTDILYAVENDRLGTVDVTTGRFTALPSIVGSGNGAVGLITFDNVESLAFNPFTGHLYATHRRGLGNADVLFRVDPTSGAAIPGAFGGDDYVPIEIQYPYHHAADLAFDPTDGRLYAIHWDLAGNWTLASVDPATGATVTIGAIPQNMHGLAFDAGGSLWATTADSPDPFFLYHFDKTDASVLSTATIDNGGNYESIAISFPFNPNQPPVFDQDLLDRAETEGTAISIPAPATDPDPGDILFYAATGLPPGIAINPTSGLVSGTISFTAGGSYTVVITATDDGIPNLGDTDTFTWTITEANQPPVFDQDLLDGSDAEGDTISLSAGATDPDLGDTLLYTALGLPAGLGIDPGSGLVSGTLPFTAAGTYPVTITVADDGAPSLNDVDTFTWTISNTNRPPVIVNPGAQTTPELAPYSLLITASDPDLTTPSFGDGGSLPSWATLTDNFDGTATISGTPGGGDSATTTVTVTADDGFLSDDAVFDLTVTNTNLPPVIVNPGNQFGTENAAFSLILSATDPDTTHPTFSATGLPAWATLADNGDGTAVLAGTPGYEDAGITTVTITADDGDLTADAVFTIDIANSNRPPAVDPVGDQATAEADPFTLTVTATDPDLTIPAFSATGLPAWATLTDNGDSTALLAGTPGYEDAGITTVTITATDDGPLSTTETFTLTVTNTNRPPVVSSIGDKSTAEATPFLLIVAASDPDLTVPFLNVAGLPDWAGFTDNGDGTATITGTPGYTDAASTLVTITATDDGPLSTTETFTLTVTNTNRPPVMDPIADQSVAEAAPFSVTLSATDPDTPIPAFSGSGLPGWATLTDNGDGTATLTGTPGYTDAGVTTVTITASDGALTDDTTFTLTVTNTNRAPTVDPIANATVAEADTLTPIVVTASDPDLTIPSLTATGLPAWATFTDNADGTGTITGTPDYFDAGAHLITITADDGTLNGDGLFSLTVANTNRPPVMDPIADQSVAENAPFSLIVSGSDPDLTVPFLNVTGLPTWASFTDNGDGTATITGTPGYTDAASTLVTITATDDGPLTATETFTLTITNTNRAPSITNPGPQSSVEAAPYSLLLSAVDPDGDTVTVTDGGSLPGWATLVDHGDGTATIAGTPGYDDAGITTVTIIASDGALTDDAVFDITITNTNRAPVVDPISDQTVAEADPFTLTVTGSDPDLTVPFLNVAGLPAWAGFTDNGDGTATITGTPGYEDAATHPITITATDDGPLTATETFTLTITNTNRAPGATDDAILIPAEAASIVFAVLGNDSDPDGDAISVVSFDATTIGTVTDEGGGTFRYVPNPDAPYAEAFTYTISDPGGATATATVYVSVTAPAPLPPIPPVELPALVGLAPIYGTELAPIGFTAAITLDSAVGFTLVDGPAGAIIDPATGVFSWIPTESQGPADYTFIVRITDPDGAFLDESVVAVSVGELETAPRLLPSGPFIAEPGTTFTATFRASDPDLPAVRPRFELSEDRPPGAVLDPATGVLVWDITPGQQVGRTDVTIRVVDGSDPTLRDEMTITVTVGAASSSQRKATLIAGLLPAQGDERSLPTPAETESGVQRTLVIMARAGMGSAQAFGAPFLLMALLTVLVISFGRISIHPLLGRSRRHSGTVAWFDAASGYGFIIPDQAAEELFLHRSALGRGRAGVAPGDRVTFRTVKGSQRSFALKVRDEAHS